MFYRVHIIRYNGIMGSHRTLHIAHNKTTANGNSESNICACSKQQQQQHTSQKIAEREMWLEMKFYIFYLEWSIEAFWISVLHTSLMSKTAIQWKSHAHSQTHTHMHSQNDTRNKLSNEWTNDDQSRKLVAAFLCPVFVCVCARALLLQHRVFGIQSYLVKARQVTRMPSKCIKSSVNSRRHLHDMVDDVMTVRASQNNTTATATTTTAKIAHQFQMKGEWSEEFSVYCCCCCFVGAWSDFSTCSICNSDTQQQQIRKYLCCPSVRFGRSFNVCWRFWFPCVYSRAR